MSDAGLVFEIEIKSSPERIWEAITSPDWTRRYFFDTAVRSDWRKGGKVVWENPDGSASCQGEVLESDPPWRLVTTWSSLWGPEMARETPSRVTWEIEERAAKRCLLRVTHDRLEGAPQTRAAVGGGWQGAIERLRGVVEAAG
jgi:uncharacterized protein YndB with AHSA1/START domain